MPELRKDPVVGRWVIIATERARRPGHFVDFPNGEVLPEDKDCIFCHPKESFIYSFKKDPASPIPWDICVVPPSMSFLSVKNKFIREGHGLYDVINGFGSHEVVIETPEHVANMADLPVEQIQLVIDTYAHRVNELEKNPHFQFVMICKNYGVTLGNRRFAHSRSHIIAMPINPLRVKEKLTGAKEYYDAKKNCVYCDILKEELRFKKRVIMETDYFLAIAPFAAKFLFEVWIIPKNHHCDFSKGVKGFEADLAKMLKIILQKIKLGLDDRAFSFAIQTAPFRRKKSYSRKLETIEQDFHWHIEIMPQLTKVAGFEKGTGFYICPIPPEDMAQYLREVEV